MTQSATRSIIKNFLASSTASLAATVISALTNKVISLYVGPEGIGLMGVFRNFGALLAGVLTFGYTTLLVQQVSAAKAEDKQRVALSGVALFFLQFLIGFILMAFFKRPLTDYLFPKEGVETFGIEIQVVIGMALTNLFLQILIAILRGEAAVKKIGILQLVTALSSLALIFPLLKLGPIGLAINVGSGSMIGCIVGIYLLRHYAKSLASWNLWKSAFQHLKHLRVASSLITIQAVITLGSLLFVQTLVQRSLGLGSLGNFNAALLVLDTGVLVLMSSVRSYLLPILDRYDTSDAKAQFFSQFLSIIFSIALAGSLFLVIAAPWIIRLLFSTRFGEAEHLLPIFGLSLFGLTLVWMYNSLLLHFEKTLPFVVIDSVGALVFIALSYGAITLVHSVDALVWAYAFSAFLTGLFYLAYTFRKLGRHFTRTSNLFFPALGFLFVGYSLRTENTVLKLCMFLLALGSLIVQLRGLNHEPHSTPATAH